MTLYFVRHAKAGSRRDWNDDDMLRPLSKKGWKQAEAVGSRLAKQSPTQLVSSPYTRCLQTLEPLAQVTDLDIVIDQRLSEGERFEGVLELFAELPARAVLCSHGDLIPDTMAALERRGCVIESEPDWRKATVWTLHRGAKGDIVRASVWPSPS